MLSFSVEMATSSPECVQNVLQFGINEVALVLCIDKGIGGVWGLLPFRGCLEHLVEVL
jgi:hypothetical protein